MFTLFCMQNSTFDVRTSYSLLWGFWNILYFIRFDFAHCVYGKPYAMVVYTLYHVGMDDCWMGVLFTGL